MPFGRSFVLHFEPDLSELERHDAVDACVVHAARFQLVYHNPTVIRRQEQLVELGGPVKAAAGTWVRGVLCHRRTVPGSTHAPHRTRCPTKGRVGSARACSQCRHYARRPRPVIPPLQSNTRLVAAAELRLDSETARVGRGNVHHPEGCQPGVTMTPS